MKKIDLLGIDLNGCIELFGAIIRLALDDLSDPREEIKNSAEMFFKSDRYNEWCNILNVDPSYILELATRHGGGLSV